MDASKGRERDGRARGKGAKDLLEKLHVDRDELSRVLQLWRQTSHPEAEARIREFERVLSFVDREIQALEGGTARS